MKNNFCSNCGAKITVQGKYCTTCGFDLESKLQTAKPIEFVNRKKFHYPEHGRHSEIITVDDENGEPVVKFRNLHPNAIFLFFFEYLGRTSILIILLIIATIAEPILGGIISVGFLLFTYLAAVINYQNFEFEVTPNAFRKSYGVLHKYTVNIAFDQIQNINMRRSIVDQMLGIAHLEIETAGTGGVIKRNVGGLMTTAEGYIPGITVAEAKDVKALMLARIHEN